MEKINIENTKEVLEYGSSIQSEISNFSNNLLEATKSKDNGEIGKDLIILTKEIKRLDTQESNQTGIKKIFGFMKSSKSKTEEIKINYNSISGNIDKVTDSLESHRRSLMKDIHLLDMMYENNEKYYKKLQNYISNGEEILKEYKEVQMEQQKLKINESQAEASKYNDMINTCSRFEKKIHDLKLTSNMCLQMAPQIRLLQNNNTVLVEKIHSSIVNVIPLWKNQIVITLGIENNKKALEAQTKVTDMTNELLLKNSEMLKQGTLDVAKEAERSIISVETLKTTNENLIETINEVLEIQKNGALERIKAEEEIKKIETDLKNTLIQSSNYVKKIEDK